MSIKQIYIKTLYLINVFSYQADKYNIYQINQIFNIKNNRKKLNARFIFKSSYWPLCSHIYLHGIPF